MSIFQRAGATFQETKERLLGRGDEYACLSCEQAVERGCDHCPHCGEDSVVALE